MSINWSQLCLLTSCVAIPFIGSIPSRKISRQGASYYDQVLKKPSWTAPLWVFGPAWTLIYTSMGIAHACLLNAPYSKERNLCLGIYSLQLCLNWIWTPVFFKLKRFKSALGIAGILDVCIASLMYFSWNIDHYASILFIPYAGWMTFATALTYNIILLNPDEMR